MNGFCARKRNLRSLSQVYQICPILSLAGYSEEKRLQKKKSIKLDLLKTKEANSLYIFNSETLQSLQEIITFLEKMASEIDRKQDETNPADHR